MNTLGVVPYEQTLPSEFEKPKKYHKEYHTIKDRRQQKT